MFDNKKPPSVVEHTKADLLEEFSAWREFLRYEWHWLLLIGLGFVLLLVFSRPLPPRDVYLAAGQSGSNFERVAKRFVPYFEKEGINLHLINTEGSGESLSELADKKVEVNAALLVGGVAAGADYEHLRSLGSIEYVPLWFFYRGPEFTGRGVFKHFADKKISIGLDNSGTQIIMRKILQLSHIDLDERPNFLRIPHKEAANELITGRIDGMVIVDGADGPTVQRLLADKDLHLRNFVHARTYANALPFLESITLLKGSLDIEGDRPDTNIQMVASTINLLVEEDLHPAVQELFLLAAREISKDHSHIYDKPEQFPAYVDRAIKISPVAKKFYESGPPLLYPYLPLWLANYVQRVWFYLFGFIAILYPISKLLPSLRVKRSVWVVADAYEVIQQIERACSGRVSDEALQAHIDRLDQLDRETTHVWIIPDEMNRLYTMKGAINLLRMKLYQRLSHARGA